jgi:hypothetical protein
MDCCNDDLNLAHDNPALSHKYDNTGVYPRPASPLAHIAVIHQKGPPHRRRHWLITQVDFGK